MMGRFAVAGRRHSSAWRCTAHAVRTFTLTILAVLLSLVPLRAQEASEDSWNNLQVLRKGQKIQVVQMDMKSAQGTFLEYSDDGISLDTKMGVTTFAREDVLRVTLKERSKRLRNALIGAAIGGGAGIAIGAAADTGLHETGEGNLGKMLFGLIGAGAGGGIGAAIPGYPTLYRARKPRPD